MKRPVTAFAAIIAAVTAAACLDNDITGTRPLSFTLTSDVATTTVGDSITFTFAATGTSIFGVVLDYGDGVIDTLPTQSPSTVEWTQQVRRVYAVPGDFNVVGRLETGIGARSDTVAVTVTEPAG
jgi:hypothetical protein